MVISILITFIFILVSQSRLWSFVFLQPHLGLVGVYITSLYIKSRFLPIGCFFIGLIHSAIAEEYFGASAFIFFILSVSMQKAQKYMVDFPFYLHWMVCSLIFIMNLLFFSVLGSYSLSLFYGCLFSILLIPSLFYFYSNILFRDKPSYVRPRH